MKDARLTSTMAMATPPLPAFAPIPEWCRLSGMSRTGTYLALARGDLSARKLGTRVLIDVPFGLSWLRSLPAAQFRAPAPEHGA